MAVKSQDDRALEKPQALNYKDYRILPDPKAIANDAEQIETYLHKLILEPDTIQDADAYFDQFPALKHVNSFGKQVVIRMIRSSDRFQGFKIDFDNHILKPHILFLVGTLCDDFSHLHTSPLDGLRLLDIGCGALSAYLSLSERSPNLLTQFYDDHPPIEAEIMQMLGAQTYGIDPRDNDAVEYNYPIAYKHIQTEFSDVAPWLQKVKSKFDVITCFNLFSRNSFTYHYHSPKAIAEFFKGLRAGLSRHSLVYTSAPLLPSSQENRDTNRRIFDQAGFRILYEGYYVILEPRKRKKKKSKS